ncbi:hypothetical protein CA54_49950 [Symmachiella macrocystis]|uniref:Putative zinc-finger domain-containing protein n=1 Tax=Symmachiella macrocystis TaxID=2527985 RepID=A0A5C6B3U6_9PLAN|nr:zf-HC2 domain-containing protein [Symmachiella macrocystis]TWU06598.1 hypothetical protein CA54_49950 [Symmachiella macrocystis]
MSENQSNANEWQACPQGEMGRLVVGLRGKRRTRQSMVIGGTASAVIVLLLVGNFAINKMQSPEMADLACHDVESMADKYVSGKLGPAETEHVRLHLENCRRCREKIAKLQKGKADGDVALRRAWQLRQHESRAFAGL